MSQQGFGMYVFKCQNKQGADLSVCLKNKGGFRCTVEVLWFLTAVHSTYTNSSSRPQTSNYNKSVGSTVDKESSIHHKPGIFLTWCMFVCVHVLGCHYVCAVAVPGIDSIHKSQGPSEPLPNEGTC